jgi:hypothetical protein
MRAVFTNDDAGASTSPRSVADFTMVVDWLNGLGIRGTFFWVPEPHDHDAAHRVWTPALLRARDHGHDFQLHGLSHGNCLEFGLPQESTRRANPVPFDEYAAHREYWEEQHTRASLRGKLERGVAHYERLFGERPVIFRSPCFGVCSQMYEALWDVGLTHSSSRGLNPTATAYTFLGDPDLRRWAPDFPCRPWVEPVGVTEHPTMEDYLLAGVPAEKVDDWEDLIRSELRHCLDELGEGGVLIFGSHYSAMAKTWDTTRPLLERVLAWLGEQGVTEWVTFAGYLEE